VKWCPTSRSRDKLHELSGASEQTFAVTAVPDEKKGERLIVLHTLPEDKLEACLALLAKSDLPALWKPRPDQFVHVDVLPYLGTGKARPAASEGNRDRSVAVTQVPSGQLWKQANIIATM